MERPIYIQKINQFFEVHPITAILGPRQCGKTTLAKMYAKTLGDIPVHHFDLEDPTDLVKFETPKLTLEPLKGLVIIDEIQRLPDLFPYLRVLVDRQPDLKLLILGSASRDLLRQSSETLAGRIAYLELPPFSLQEVHHMPELWLRGGFPRSYLAPNIDASIVWREQYISTFLERDIPNLGIQIPPATLRRFWMMLAHYHGATFNAQEIANAIDVSHASARRYLDILTGTFMIRQLQPWLANIKKRQVKAPKIYFKDSGIFHTLLGITDQHSLYHHPKLGASWEGFALEEIIRFYQATPEESYFWATHGGAELDLLIIQRGKKIGFEIKYTDAPRLTRSMHLALEDLELDELRVVYPGNDIFYLKERIKVIGLSKLEL